MAVIWVLCKVRGAIIVLLAWAIGCHRAGFVDCQLHKVNNYDEFVGTLIEQVRAVISLLFTGGFRYLDKPPHTKLSIIHIQTHQVTLLIPAHSFFFILL